MGGMVKGACALALAVGLCFTGVSGVCGAQDQAASQGADDQGLSPEVNKPDQVNGANKGSATGKASQAKKNQVFTLGEVEVVGKEDDAKNTTIERILTTRCGSSMPIMWRRATNLSPASRCPRAVKGMSSISISEVLARGIWNLPGWSAHRRYLFWLPASGRIHHLRPFGDDHLQGLYLGALRPQYHGGRHDLITIKPQKEYEVNGGSGYGSGNSYHGFANLGTNQGKWYFEGGGSYENQDYFNLADSFTSTPYWGKGLTGSQGAGQRVNSDYYNWRKISTSGRGSVRNAVMVNSKKYAPRKVSTRGILLTRSVM